MNDSYSIWLRGLASLKTAEAKYGRSGDVYRASGKLHNIGLANGSFEEKYVPMAQRRLPGSGMGRTGCNAGASPSGGKHAMPEQGPLDKECRIDSRGSQS